MLAGNVCVLFSGGIGWRCWFVFGSWLDLFCTGVNKAGGTNVFVKLAYSCACFMCVGVCVCVCFCVALSTYLAWLEL